MPNYRRAFIAGGTWFFTVNLLERHRNGVLVREVELQSAQLSRTYCSRY
jgi:putative transposase